MDLNAWLDRMPRTRFGRATRSVPAFLVCGVVGFYAAVLVIMGGALVTGRSLVVTAVLSLVCALSFFAYAHARRAVTGRETLELLDQVWFALLCVAGTLLGLGLPLFPYLDIVAVAMCPFLAAGRVGCTLVGCCHGRPSAIGIRYGDEHARDGFPAHLVGIRLLPVPAIEAAGFLGIGATGFLALATAPAGAALTWFLVAYAIIRFGLEELRGDRRPYAFGLSKPQWMCLAQFGVGLWIGQGLTADVTRVPGWVLAGLLVTALAGSLVLRRRVDRHRHLLDPRHVEELRRLVDDALEAAARAVGVEPQRRLSSAGVSVVATTSNGAARYGLHLSLSLGDWRPDLPLLCELTARALPEGTAVVDVAWSATGVLHLAVAPGSAARTPGGKWLYRLAVLGLQAETGNRPASNGSAPVAPPVHSGMPRTHYFGARSPGEANGAGTASASLESDVDFRTIR